MPGAPKAPWSPLTRARVGRRRLLHGGALAGATALFGGALPAVTRAAPAALPAAQGAEPALTVLTSSPLNASSPLWALDGTMTPNPWFFIRDHFAPAPLSPEAWRMDVGGVVLRPQSLNY